MGHDKYEAEKRTERKAGGRKGRLSEWKASQGRNKPGTADWGIATPEVLQRLIWSVTAGGGAILLGYSRDRGAYRIILMEDDEKHTEWIPCTADLDAYLEAITETFEGLDARRAQDSP